VCVCVCEQLSGTSSSPIVTKFCQSYPWPQETRLLNFGRSRSVGDICALLNAVLIIACFQSVISLMQVLCLEVERLNQEDILSTFRDSLQSQQSNNSSLRDRLIQLEQVETSLHEYAYWLFVYWSLLTWSCIWICVIKTNKLPDWSPIAPISNWQDVSLVYIQQIWWQTFWFSWCEFVEQFVIVFLTWHWPQNVLSDFWNYFRIRVSWPRGILTVRWFVPK